MKPTLHAKTLIAVARIINGDDAIWMDHPASPWRSDDEIEAFFIQTADVSKLPHVGDSREERTAAWLLALNGTEMLARLIEESVRPSNFAHSTFDIERAVSHINDKLIIDGYQLIRRGKGYVLCEHGQHVNVAHIQLNILSNEYVLQMANKCGSRLAANDLEGAITNACTLVEAVLVELENRLTGTRTDFQGHLQKQFKHVMKIMRLDDESNDPDESSKEVIRGLVAVVSGMAALRNKMSDGHARARKPEPHHARLVVNAAKTIADFLVGSYVFPREKGPQS